ncbi:DUF707 domain-containing protein [Labrys miyagiensis]|uniref:DUF707 domain-containing protein n=1 Tax=Labrys miyagiensis TaxID=346912 RepID=UPI0024E0A8E0|nr:DUF707 domain-containing protein [Labrys miyagiensis]
MIISNSDNPLPSSKHSEHRRWCIFTSAGNFDNVTSWIERSPTRSWDLITAFYGDYKDTYDRLCLISDICLPMKGGKFQNLKKFYDSWPDIIDRYDFIFVADDDLILRISDFDAAFGLAQQLDLWVCQPAFSQEGKISHPITAHVGGTSSIRFVNFVENTCPLFRSDRLKSFLDVFDDHLSGWGIDWWYCNHLGSDVSGRFAILDEVVVLNPYDHQRPGRAREITKLRRTSDRYDDWLRVKAKYGLSEYPHQLFDTIHKASVGPFGD